MADCTHIDRTCINHYELIRKYECSHCGGIMMCACDEARGREFLPHQLQIGTRQESQEPVQCTLGFVSAVCNECRGLPVEAYPAASILGRTSKIKRYYWRELLFREQELFKEYGGKPANYICEIGENESETVRRAKEQALVDIKKLHAANPKYSYRAESTHSVISSCNVAVRNIHVEYVQDGQRKAKVSHDETLLTVEEYAATIYRSLGYEVLFLESMPFHVIFSVLTWIVIQDHDDPNVKVCGFGERSAYEADGSKNPIWVPLPSDFGTSAYAKRRSMQIEHHFDMLLENQDDLPGLFDLWLPYSEGLRQYLWAHREEHIWKARTLVKILEPLTTLTIVRYLLNNYWKRYLGWPDLFVFNASGYLFVEVKSSKDKLSEEQKCWIENNSTELHLPFELLKVHRLQPAREPHPTDVHGIF